MNLAFTIAVDVSLTSAIWLTDMEGLTLLSRAFAREDGVVETAIAREKQLKGWSRAKKIALIEKINPGWEDLAPSFSNLGPSTAARRDLMG